MKILNDEELETNIRGKTPYVTGVPEPPGGDWYHKQSAIQPSSIDLHMGNIYVPGTKKEESGGEDNPKEKYILRAGQTAIITTLEELKLPSDISCIAFPPSRVSFQGLLMTNPGHVDPGFEGHMRFTVINMGREDIDLRRGDEIVTVLFFELSNSSKPSKINYKVRLGPAPPKLPKQSDINKLSADFLDVDNRATSRAEEIVKGREKFAGLIVEFW